MKVLLTGGTGYIGASILRELIAHGHKVVALARSGRAGSWLRACGAEPLWGDLREPQAWAPVLLKVDAVIHSAATFTEDMATVDRRLVETLIRVAGQGKSPLRVVYTGGCWLYGATGERVAAENDAYEPLPAFAWMVEGWRRLRNAENSEPVLVHPALVHERTGGIVASMIADARAGGPIRIVGSSATRWPLVHREDLAMAYRLVLETGVADETYNVATDTGVRVGAIAAVIAKRFGLGTEPVVKSAADMSASLGVSAVGYALDQQMSAIKIGKNLGWRPQRSDALAELA